MKKLITCAFLMALYSNYSMAENVAGSPSQDYNLKNKEGKQMLTPEEYEKKYQKKKERDERYNNASPEEKARMDKHHQIMEKLTPEQKELVKKERERHRQEMKKITGVDIWQEKQ
jgi:hypothetical protein